MAVPLASPARAASTATGRVRFTSTADLAGFAGDTLASALLANGVHLVGRSFKYHRPRGILSAGAEEPNALVGTDRGGGRFEPNTRATMVELYDGLAASSQNRWPSLELRRRRGQRRALPCCSRPASTTRPSCGRSLLEQGLRAVHPRRRRPRPRPPEPDPDTLRSRFAHCDVLVVGAGPAGLAAALAAGRGGAKVILCDEQAELGGSLLRAGRRHRRRPAWDWLERTPRGRAGGDAERHRAAAHHGVRLLPPESRRALASASPTISPSCRQAAARAAVEGAGQAGRAGPGRHRAAAGLRRQRPAGRHAGGGGAHLPQPLRRAVGERVVVVSAHDTAWVAAFDLAQAGVDVAAIVDVRRAVADALAARASAPRHRDPVGGTVTDTEGRLRVASFGSIRFGQRQGRRRR